jgi:hypothetical protein
MPYAPGVQDISGQLLAQGMQARAQGIAGGVQTLFQGLQQNQMMTGQALARFQAATAANPKLLDFLNQGGSGQSPVPVNPDILKAYADIKSGKTNVQNTALLAQFADTYNQAEMNQQMQMMRQAQMQSMQSEDQLRQAQTMKMLAELQGIGMPKGRIMSLTDFQKLPATIDAKGKPVQGRPDLIEVTDYNLRAGEQSKAPLVIPGDAITRVVDPSDPTKVLATYENIKVGPGQRLVGAGPEKAPSSPPAALPQFLPSGSMAGAAPQTTASAVPTAALAAMMPSSSGLRIENIPGGTAAKEAAEQERAEAAKSVREFNSAKNILSGIERIERNLDQTVMGVEPVGMYSGARKAISQAAVNVAEGIDTIVANVGFDELRSLKESGTSLGQVAIKELDNLQRLRGSLSQNLGKPEFKRTLQTFKQEAQRTMQRLDYLNRAYNSGATALSEAQLKEYNKLGGTFSPTETQRIPWNSGSEPGKGSLGRNPSLDARKFEGADRQAYEWLLRNPNDPRADAIRRKLGL